MDSSQVLADAFDRLPRLVTRAASGLSADELAYRPDSDANSIAWLIWHLTRIHDDHVADLAGQEQVLTAEGWHGRLGLPFDALDTGYGHTPEQVAAVHPPHADDLLGYHRAVTLQTLAFLETVDDNALERVVDRSWNPPVTAGVRLVSVIGDCHQHVGQASYLRGLIERRRD
jgi:uncharacterized damage-inducible protein DinB